MFPDDTERDPIQTAMGALLALVIRAGGRVDIPHHEMVQPNGTRFTVEVDDDGATHVAVAQIGTTN